MSLKAVPIWVCANHSPQHSYSQLGGVSDLVGAKRCRFVGYARMECFGALSAQRAKTPVEDDKPLTKPIDSIDVSQLSQSVGFHKDLNSLPSELDFSPFFDSCFIFLVHSGLLKCDFGNACWGFGFLIIYDFGMLGGVLGV